jgi:hypothetical protein
MCWSRRRKWGPVVEGVLGWLINLYVMSAQNGFIEVKEKLSASQTSIKLNIYG